MMNLADLQILKMENRRINMKNQTAKRRRRIRLMRVAFSKQRRILTNKKCPG